MISHPFILFFYFLTEKINRIFSIFHKKAREKNYLANKDARGEEENVFLDDQSAETLLLYGRKPFSHSGCGTAAVFNALLSLGIPMPLPDVIRYFEKRGASMFGSFGTAPQSAFRFFNDRLRPLSETPESPGFTVKKSADRREFKDLAESSDVLILTIMNNRKKIRSMLHTMCVERIADYGDQKDSSVEKSSRYIVHNSHGRAEIYPGYEEMMSSLGDGEGRADGVYMVAITKPAIPKAAIQPSATQSGSQKRV